MPTYESPNAYTDEIYEEALTTRESYCTSLISAAFAVKEVTGGGGFMTSQQPNVPIRQQQQQPYEQPPMMMQSAPQPTFQSMQQPKHVSPEMMGVPPNQTQNEAANNMITPPLMNEGNIASSQATMPTVAREEKPPPTQEEHPFSDPTQLQPQAQKKPKQASEKKVGDTKQQMQPSPDEEYEPADSALPFMIMSLFSLLFSMGTFVIKIPFRIGSMIFTFWVLIVVLRVLWLLLADDNGAWEMGAGVDLEYNMPGIY